MPFGHEAVLDLRAFEESLAPEPARTDGDFRLIDVVVRAEGIADDAQKTQDAVALVLFENRIEDIVGGGEEDHRAEKKPHGNQGAAQVHAEGIDEHADQRQQRHGQQAGVQVHHAGRDECHRHAEQDARQRQRGQIDQARAPLPGHHRFGERADQNDRHEQRHRRKQERHDEQRGDQQHRDAEPLVESLAVKHEEERAEHDARTGVVLQDDDEKRDADHHAHLEEVARTVDREGVGAHHAGQRESRGDLHEFDGLQAERTEFEPRLGTVHLAAEQQRAQQQRQSREIGRVDEHMVEPFVEQQHHERRGPRHADPHQLLHVEVREGEDIGRALVVRRRGDRHPPRQHDQHVQQDRPEVHSVKDTMAVSGHTKGNRCSYS